MTPRRETTTRCQQGATTAEYIAVLLLLVALIGTLGATGLGGPMTDAIRTAMCSINVEGGQCAGGGGTDDLPPSGREDPPRPPTCTISTEGESINGSVTVASADFGADASYTLTETRTGDTSTYDVTLTFSGSLAGKLSEGGKISTNIDGLRAGKQGDVSAGGKLTYSPTFRFDDREDAEALIADTRDLVTGPIDDTFDLQTLIPIYGPARVANNQAQRILDYNPGDVHTTRIEGEVFAEASGSIYEGGAGAEGEARGGQAIGGEYDHTTGSTTLYYKTSAEVAGALGLQVVGGSAGIESEVVVKVTMDDEWNLSSLDVGWTGTGKAGVDTLSLQQLWFAEGTAFPADVSEAFGVGASGSEQDTWTLEAAGSVDLTDPRLRSAGEDFVDGLVNGNVGDTLDAGREVGDYVINDSDLLVQYHTGDSSSGGFDIQGGKVLAFGLSAGGGSDNRQLQNAWYRPGGSDWITGACE